VGSRGRPSCFGPPIVERSTIVDSQAQITLRLNVTKGTNSLYAIVDGDYADLFQIAADVASGVVAEVLVDLRH
jgi:hypothetical protein